MANCMRAHGIKDFLDPTSDGRISINAGPGSDLNPNNPLFQTAQNACAGLLPGGGVKSLHSSPGGSGGGNGPASGSGSSSTSGAPDEYHADHSDPASRRQHERSHLAARLGRPPTWQAPPHPGHRRPPAGGCRRRLRDHLRPVRRFRRPAAPSIMPTRPRWRRCPRRAVAANTTPRWRRRSATGSCSVVNQAQGYPTGSPTSAPSSQMGRRSTTSTAVRSYCSTARPRLPHPG